MRTPMIGTCLVFRPSLEICRLNSNALTLDTRVRGQVALEALHYERLLTREAKVHVAPLCINFSVVRDP